MNIARTELSSREARLQHSRHISIWLLNISSSKYLHAEKKYAKNALNLEPERDSSGTSLFLI